MPYLSKPRLKICGITNLDDARLVAALGADYLGFIFYPGSPRYVEPERVREILAWIHGPEPVGVFLGSDPEEILQIVAATGIRTVQLHGLESPEQIRRLRDRGLRIIKTLHVAHDASIEHLRALAEPYRELVDYLLLDAIRRSLGRHGGVLRLAAGARHGLGIPPVSGRRHRSG